MIKYLNNPYSLTSGSQAMFLLLYPKGEGGFIDFKEMKTDEVK